MSTKQIAAAAQADADICNAVMPPAQGCAAGGGAHIVIPGDWQARIAAAQQVPGCTYAALDVAGALIVDDLTQARLATPAIVNALTAPQQAQVTLLNAKLATATVLASAQVAQAQQEVIP